jgi:RNA polymerase subunit RPABC4/transcription elongation factor Spt4
MITEQNKEDNTMNHHPAWELNANTAKEVYGCHVDYEERFYICPYCGETVYEEDWSEESLEEFMCPICEDEDAEE